MCLTIWLAGCSSSQPAAVVEEPVVVAEDTVAVVLEADTVDAVLPTYLVLGVQQEGFVMPQSAYDLLHTVLDLQVDFPAERVHGTAMHVLSPVTGEVRQLSFDAHNLDIELITLAWGRAAVDGERIDTLRYETGERTLTVHTNETLSETDTVRVTIAYAATPMAAGNKLGMVFVDGAGTDPAEPTQVWTLGQPEDNAYWFPTWDYPNDFSTYEIALTVPGNFTTVANGTLVEQTSLGKNLRRDRWVLDAPHASYLTSVVAGEYATIKDTFRRRDQSTVPLEYMVEPKYAPHAKLIFGETPRMMAVFEEKAGTRYPWANYKQVAVREFTAGGMEHTTASTMTSSLQHDPRAHLDYTGRDLIAHELAHQWFGNLFTARNWAHLALNEGFASFMEEVYLEEAYGQAPAQEHRIDSRAGYLAQAQSLRRPIIWYGYSDPNQMFDAHTYNKAEQVLVQLRHEMGDKAFWSGVRGYVRNNRHQTVVLDDLQEAMEEASGRSLHGFFQQWFLSPGHPELLVTQGIDEVSGRYQLRVQQVQNLEQTPLFSFPVDIELNFHTLEPFVQRVQVASKDTTFVFAGSAPFAFVRFDEGDHLLADIRVEKPVEEWINQARRDDEMAGRYDAIVALSGLARKGIAENREIRDVLVNRVINDPSAFARRAAAQGLVAYVQESYVSQTLSRAAIADPDASVRRAALLSLHEAPDLQARAASTEALSDSSYYVVATAIRLLAEQDSVAAWGAFQPLLEIVSWQQIVERALVRAIATTPIPEGIPYVLESLAPDRPDALKLEAVRATLPLIESFPDWQMVATERLISLLENVDNRVRIAAAAALKEIGTESALSEIREMRERQSTEAVRLAIDEAIRSLEREGG